MTVLGRVLWGGATLLALAVTGCAHKPASGADIDRIERPAFVARIEEGAGPKSNVFRDDGSYKSRLKRLDAVEGDRRLAKYLAEGSKGGRSITRFEVADTLRAETLALLPKELPWTNTIDPAAVASVLESFLVLEVPANAPDYDLLKQLEADAVVEIVVEDYGMRSENGKAGAYLKGFARVFFVGGGEVYYRRFFSDDLRAGLEGLDPFEVAKDPTAFRERTRNIVLAVAQVVAKDLSPSDRRGGPSLDGTKPPEGGDVVTPKEFKRTREEEDPL